MREILGAMTRREKRVWRRVAFCFALVAAVMAVCAGAQAKTVQVGSPLIGSFSPVLFGDPAPLGGGADKFTLLQTWLSVPGGVANVTSPVDGTVISYRVASADGTFAIQVIRVT